MSRWEPHIDLTRLLEALANEIVATTAQEVRQTCTEGRWSAGRSVKEMWELIDAVNGEPGEPEIDGGSSMARIAEEIRKLTDAVNDNPGEPQIDFEKVRIELRTSRHLQSAAERGSRTCHKQH